MAEQFRVVELRAIKIQTIGEVRRLIQSAQKQGMQKIAPQSFAAAQQKLEEADAFITQNPYQKEKMHKLAAEALFMAQRLHIVAGQSEKVKNMEPEQITLWAEDIVYQVSDKLGAQATVCAGGRYDTLSRQLGGTDTPAVGLLLTGWKKPTRFLPIHREKGRS